jgi:hypothetical protein
MNGGRTLATTPAPKREIRFAPLSWKAPPLPPLLEGVAESVALAPISACSRIGSAPVPPSLRPHAHGRSRLGHSPSQRQGDRHTRAQAVGGKPSASRLAPAVSKG